MPTTTNKNNNAASWCSLKDVMKRTQRISIEFQQREVTFTVLGPAAHPDDHRPCDEPQDATAVCPVCGSPWISVSVNGGKEIATTASGVYRALEQVGLHLQVSPTGDLQICRKSLEEIKEKP